MGPEIVAGILENPNRLEVLNTMYDDLVLPTVKLIESNKNAEARQFYIDYTLALADTLKS